MDEEAVLKTVCCKRFVGSIPSLSAMKNKYWSDGKLAKSADCNSVAIRLCEFDSHRSNNVEYYLQKELLCRW